MSGWGEDPNKWVIAKGSYGWCVSPPHDGEMWIHPSFEAAVSVFADLTKCNRLEWCIPGPYEFEMEDLGEGRSISRGFVGCATCDGGGCRDCDR